MKKLIVLLGVSFLLFSCFEVEQFDSSQIKDKLKLAKPMVISDGEILAIAQEIGDSLTGVINVAHDKQFYLGKHEVTVVSKTSDTLTTGKLKNYYEAYEYAISQNQKINSDVKKPRRKSFVNYYNVKTTPDSVLKMVLIKVDLEDVTLKIANDRKLKKDLWRASKKD